MEFTIAAFSSWAPALSQSADWLAWHRGEVQPHGTAPPDLGHIKPMQRRRLSLTARAVFYVANQCLVQSARPQEVATVFSSAYGPTPMTANMLEKIAQDKALSPTSFSLSVHNAVAGQLSIAHHIKTSSVTLAPGQEGVGASFLQAACILQAHPGCEVLLCFYDEPLDERLGPFEQPLPATMACAILLKGVDAYGNRIQCHRVAHNEVPPLPFWQQVLNLGAFLISDDSVLTLGAGKTSYQWRKS